MSKLQKRAFLFVSLSLVITFIFLIHLNFARAEEVEDILPSQGLDSVTLLAGQSVDFEGTFTTPSGTHSIGVISLFNQSLEVKVASELKNITGGVWWILLIGTSTKNGFDFVYGIPPYKGATATVSFELPIGIGFTIFGVSGGSLTSAEDPVKYKINVAGKL